MPRVGTCKLLLILLAGLFCMFVLHALSAAPIFEKGVSYELYFGTSSAEIVSAEDPALIKLFRPAVKGESALYEGDKRRALEEKFHARLLFTEEAAGVTNYYYYTPDLGHGILLFGHTVNLHIAVSAERTKAGTPLIFGGY